MRGSGIEDGLELRKDRLMVALYIARDLAEEAFEYEEILSNVIH